MPIVTYKDFTGGYNDTVPPDALKDNEMQKCENFDTFNRGGFKQRQGCDKLNGVSYAGEITQLIDFPLSNGESKLLAVIETSDPTTYKLHEIHSDGTKTELLTIQSNEVGAVPYRNRLYILDGTKYYVYGDYYQDTNVGLVDIETGDIVINTPTSTGGGTGGNVYRAKSDLGWTNTGAEDFSATANWDDITSNYWTTADGTQTIALNDIVYNSPASTGNGTTGHYYKALAAHGSTDLSAENYGNKNKWLDVTATVNSSTFDASVDVVTDMIIRNKPTSTGGGTADRFYKAKSDLGVKANLTEEDFSNATNWEDVTDSNHDIIPDDIREVEANEDLENDLTPIKRCKYIIWHPTTARFFVAGDSEDPSALYFSETGDPTFFKGTSILYPGTADGDITALTNIGKSVLVGYENGWRSFTAGTDIDIAADSTFTKLPVPIGTASNNSVVLAPHSLIFLHKTGFYRMDMAIINNDSNVILQNTSLLQNLSRQRVELTINSIQNLANVKMVYHDNKVYMAYSDDATTPNVNNKVLVYDLEQNGFARYSGWQVNWFLSTAKDGTLSFGSKNYILKPFNGENDIDTDTGNDIAVNGHVKLKPYSLGGKGEEFIKKYVNKIFYSAQQQTTDNQDVNIKINSDYSNQDYDVTFNESLIWGRLWGLTWGFNEIITREARINRGALRHQLEFTTDDTNNSVFIYAVGFDYMNMPAQVARETEALLINDTNYS